MKKIENRRHLYLEQDFKSSLITSIEQVDNYLESSFNLDALSSDIILYYTQNEVLLVGREVVGTDPNVKYHDSLKMKDYRPEESELIEIEVNSLEDLETYIVSNKLSRCRIIFKNQNFFKAKIYSF